MSFVIRIVLALTIFTQSALGAVTVNVNGTSHTIPQTNEKGWGANVTAWIQAISANTLQPNGGQFLLTNELDFGPNFGVKTPYIKSRALNPATTGFFRLGNSEGIGWRNAANTGNYLLTVNPATGVLEFDGAPLLNTASVAPLLALKADQTSLDAHTSNVSNPHAVTKAQVGLDQVDNTSDAAKNVATATLTNKSIDADSNTLTNIGNAAIKAAAGISYSKLNLTGSVTNADLAGSIQDAKLAQITATNKVANSATTASALDAANAIVARDATGGAGLNTLTLSELSSTPATPSAGFKKLYAKNNGKSYTLNSSGVESILGAGGGGGSKNYITDGDGEAGPIGVGYSDTAVPTSVVSGGITRISTTTVSPLVGSQSLLFTPGPAIGGTAVPFTVDREDFGRVLQSDISIELGGTGYLDGALQFWIVAPSGAVIQPTGFSVLNASGPGKVRFTFQTEATGTQYYLKIHQSTTVNTWTAKLEIKLGPQVVSTGAFVGDLQNAGPITIGAVTTPPTKGTTSNDVIRWRRVGDHAEIKGEYKQTAAGTVGSGDYLFSLPASLQFDSNKISFFTGGSGQVGANPQAILGSANAGEGLGSTTGSTGFVVPYDATRFRIYVLFSATGTSNGRGFVGSGFYSINQAASSFSFDFSAPIAGWGSSQVLSQDAGDGRLVAAQGSANTTTAVGASANVKVNFNGSVFYDTFGAFNNTLSRFTAPVSGVYRVSTYILTAISQNVGTGPFIFTANIWKNGASYQQIGWTVISGNYQFSVQGSNSIQLNAGDYIEIYAFQNSGTTLNLAAGNSYFAIERISTGNQQIAASETIAASFWASANSSLPNATPLNFDSKEFDTHNAVTVGSSWRFTAPAAGLYNISSALVLSGAGVNFAIYKNGVVYKAMGGGTNSVAYSLNTTLRLNAGDFIDIRANGATSYYGGALGSPLTTNINILRVGN